ncbi:MAG: MBL fold metallo-hydrolase [Gemmatimonadetes bacterium]|nr:MBL fold metallo-hydrolase [Gemmatimonadota bacterium]
MNTRSLPALRRVFLATLLPLGAATAQSAQDYPSILSYKTVTVARGVYGFITPEERTGLQAGNSIAVEGDSAVLVFDTGAMPTVTRRQIAELRTLTGKPVRYVVTSHWHPDHHLGNHEYQQAFPGVRFIGTKATQQGILDRGAHFIKEVQGFAATDSLMRLRLSTGKMRDGRPLPATTRTIFELNTRDFAEFMPEVSRAIPLTSNQVLDDSLRIDLGGRVVMIYTRGWGNTSGDAFAYVPDVGVLLTGDLLTFPCPFPSTAYFNDWIPLLDHLKTFRPRAIVPGHGEVQHDLAFLEQTRTLLQFTRDQAADAVKRGRTLEQFTAEVSFARFLPLFAGSDVVRTDAFNSFYISAAVPRAFLEATLATRGERPPPYPPS